MFNCSSLVVFVGTAADFASADTSSPALYDASNNPITGTYSPGTQNSIMVVKLVYPWSVFTGPLGFNIATAGLPNNAKEMMGVTAFKVEPY